MGMVVVEYRREHGANFSHLIFFSGAEFSHFYADKSVGAHANAN